MTTQEAFKIGFLTKCAELGLTAEETTERIKQAHARVKMAQWGKFLASLPGWLTKGLMVGAIVPPVAGAVGGYAMSQAHDRPYSKDMARKDEELAEYYRAMDQLARARRQREAAAA
jgi:hypothetical protein